MVPSWRARIFVPVQILLHRDTGISVFMTNEQIEQWNKLCAEAAKETNPKKLTALMSEIVKMLRDKHEELTDKDQDRSKTLERPIGWKP